jgi:hypothetical protein
MGQGSEALCRLLKLVERQNLFTRNGHHTDIISTYIDMSIYFSV